MRKISIFMVLALLAMPGMALAAPGIPHLFWGDVTYNGQLVPGGLTVTAKIEGVEIISTTTTQEGTYSLIVTDPDQNRTGATVNFFVEYIDTGESGIFCNGCTEPKIDLTLETDVIYPIITITFPENRTSLGVGTKETLINISTDENAVCRYGTEPDFDYETATYFTNTDNLEHTFTYAGLSDGQIYNLYYKCKDTNDNINAESIYHTFSISTQQLYCGDGICNNGETCSSCPTDCVKCPSGGGGGSFIPLTTNDEENETEDSTTNQDEPEEEGCVETWVCSSWSDCEESIQTRECFDKNDCGTEVNMPFESQPCSLVEEQIKKESQQSGFFPTGFASLAMLSNPTNIAIIGILLAAILIGFYLKTKKFSENILGK